MRIVKICKIHGKLTVEKCYEQGKSKITNEPFYLCRHCRKENYKKWNLNKRSEQSKLLNKKTKQECHKRVKQKFPDRNKQKAKEWRKRNPEKSRMSSLLSKHKITENQYKKIIKDHNGKCAICKTDARIKSKTEGLKSALAIDHCHETGKIRGLLCHGCNIALGAFKDSIKNLKEAIGYLLANKDYRETKG